MTKTPVRASRAKAKPEVKKPGAKAAAAKTAKPKKAKATPAAPAKPAEKKGPDAKDVLKIILEQAEDMKAEDTVTIDLKGTSSEADFVVVTTGRSNRHVGSIADRVVEGLRAVGVKSKVEGMPNCDWVLIDAGDAIVHVFRPEVRTFYNLEKMWAGAAGPRRAS